KNVSRGLQGDADGTYKETSRCYRRLRTGQRIDSDHTTVASECFQVDDDNRPRGQRQRVPRVRRCYAEKTNEHHGERRSAFVRLHVSSGKTYCTSVTYNLGACTPITCTCPWVLPKKRTFAA